MRLVGFQRKQHKKLAKYQEKKESVAIQNRKVRHGRQSDELEIPLRSSSRVEASPKFCTNRLEDMASTDITLENFEVRSGYDRVNVKAKVIRADEPVKVSGGLNKQDVATGDCSAAARLTLWEKEIGTVKVGKSYQFNSVVVRGYQGEKYLSKAKEAVSIVEIDDIGEVAEDDLPEVDTLSGAEVAGVITFNLYAACLRCKSKVKPTTGKLGKCTKCGMQQCIEQCKEQLNAKAN